MPAPVPLLLSIQPLNLGGGGGRKRRLQRKIERVRTDISFSRTGVMAAHAVARAFSRR